MWYDAELLSVYREPEPIESEVPLGADAWLADAWDTTAVAIDLPISALGDSLKAPIVLAAGSSTPDPAGLGCGWSVPPREPASEAGARDAGDAP
mgnify:CR=1 FL=1